MVLYQLESLIPYSQVNENPGIIRERVHRIHFTNSMIYCSEYGKVSIEESLI